MSLQRRKFVKFDIIRPRVSITGFISIGFESVTFQTNPLITTDIFLPKCWAIISAAFLGVFNAGGSECVMAVTKVV